MILYVYKLDDYYCGTQKYYSLFESLFLYNDLNKEESLEKLGINYNTYRGEKRKEFVSNKNPSKLFSYFNYSVLDEEDKIYYESLLSKIYYCCYYNNVKMYDHYLSELELLMKKKNIVYPILVVFKVFIYFHKNISVDECKRILSKDFKYLKCFYNSNYFTCEFDYIYLTLMYYYDVLENVNECLEKIKTYSNKYKRLSWLYNHVRAAKAYRCGKDQEAIMHYKELLDEYKENCNMSKYFHVLNNIAYTYNLENEFEYSLSYTCKVIEYLFTSMEYGRWIKNILAHFLYSKLMLEKYDEILSFLKIIIFDMNYLDDVSASICLIAMQKYGDYSLQKDIDKVCINNKEKYILYFSVKNYFKSFSEDEFLYIGDSSYKLRIKKFLLKNYKNIKKDNDYELTLVK